MSSARDKLLELLPPVWPTKANTDPAWWAKFGSKIKLEDKLVQAEIDLLFERDSKTTGSEVTIAALKVEGKGRSLNHKRSAATCLLLRDNDPRPLLTLMETERTLGLCWQEQGARYQPRFHARSVLVALLYLEKLPPPRSERHDRLRRYLREWLQWHWYCLRSFTFFDDVLWVGFRRAFVPESLDAIQRDILDGKTILIHDGAVARDLGLVGKGGYMNGGPPRAMTEWLLFYAREQGLLIGLHPIEPHLDTPVEIDHDDGASYLAYFPRIHWRPGQGDSLVAVEMHTGWEKPKLWMVGQKEPIPAEWWGFDPVGRKIVALPPPRA